MYTWFQNLNDNPRRPKLFYFRGSFGPDYRKTWLKYEFCSGPALKLKYSHGDACDNSYSSQLCIGLFFFTAYLTFFLPRSWYFKRVYGLPENCQFLVDDREYGFYFYNWAFVWSWHAKKNESSRQDPWWMHQYIHIDDIFLGKRETLRDELTSIQNVAFKMGEKTFVMDEIKWVEHRSFRRYIPYFLYHHTYMIVDMKINKPPSFSGKGENSWDCGDDGIYGSHQAWRHARPTWQNRDAMAKLAVNLYVDSVMNSTRRYGGSNDEATGINRDSVYKYIGPIRDATGGVQAEAVFE